MENTHINETYERMEEYYKVSDYNGLNALYYACLGEAQIANYIEDDEAEKQWLKMSMFISKRLDWIYQSEISSFYVEQTIDTRSVSVLPF